MRPAVIVGLTLLAMGLTIGGGIAWHQVFWRAGWFKGPPPIVKDLVTGVENGPWTRRLRETYPIGSSAEVMTQSLEDQGFEVFPDTSSASYGWADYPCIFTLTVTWRIDEVGRIGALQGALYNACTDASRLLPAQPTPARPQRSFPRPLVAPTQSA